MPYCTYLEHLAVRSVTPLPRTASPKEVGSARAGASGSPPDPEREATRRSPVRFFFRVDPALDEHCGIVAGVWVVFFWATIHS